MTVERIKMPFGKWSDLDKKPKVSVALSAERRDKAFPSIRCQTIKPLTCLWDFEGTVLLTSHSCIFSASSVAAFSLYLLLQTHPVKQQHGAAGKAGADLMALACEEQRSSELVAPGGTNGPRPWRLWKDVPPLGWREASRLCSRSDFYSSQDRGVVEPPAWLFPSLRLVWLGADGAALA